MLFSDEEIALAERGEDFVGCEYLAVAGKCKGQSMKIVKWLRPETGQDHYLVESEFGVVNRMTGLSLRSFLAHQDRLKEAWWKGMRAGLLYQKSTPPDLYGVNPDEELGVWYQAGIETARKLYPDPRVLSDAEIADEVNYQTAELLS